MAERLGYFEMDSDDFHAGEFLYAVASSMTIHSVTQCGLGRLRVIAECYAFDEIHDGDSIPMYSIKAEINCLELKHEGIRVDAKRFCPVGVGVS